MSWNKSGPVPLERETPFLGRAQCDGMYHTPLQLVQLGSRCKDDGVVTREKTQPSCLFY